MANRPEVELFNAKFSGRLEIELTEPAEKMPNLANLRALPTAKITNLRLVVEIFDNDEFRRPTPDELEAIAFREPRIRLRGISGEPIAHRAPSGEHFTVRDLLSAVEETERCTRGQSEWFGGIDVHHIYLEGLLEEQDGSWTICWGS